MDSNKADYTACNLRAKEILGQLVKNRIKAVFLVGIDSDYSNCYLGYSDDSPPLFAPVKSQDLVYTSTSAFQPILLEIMAGKGVIDYLVEIDGTLTTKTIDYRKKKDSYESRK